jgi:hypothetical protein
MYGPNYNYENLDRDLYVKLQVLKYNFRKVCGCFCKIAGSNYFPDLQIYFSIEKAMK